MANPSHYHFGETTLVNYNEMVTWVKEIFKATGLNEEDANLVADTLVDSDVRGVYSHGTQRINIYTKRILKGCINTSGKPYIISDCDATAVIDGDNAMGQIVGKFAMEVAIEKAKKYGVSFVTVRNSNHYGRCEYYSRMAMDEDMIGFSSTIGGGNLMAPWGGTDSRVGNNPFSIAMPTKDRYPVVLDMAQSVVAKGKIDVANKTKSSIPESWALDSKGVPTNDPAEALKGSVRPIADYKGSGIAIMVGLMCSVISDAAVGDTLKDVYNDFSGGLNKGQMFMAIDIGRMTDVSAFKERMDKQVDFIKKSPVAEDTPDVYLPGELEYLSYDEQMENGIEYPIEVINEIKEISTNLKIKIPDIFK